MGVMGEMRVLGVLGVLGELGELKHTFILHSSFFILHSSFLILLVLSSPQAAQISCPRLALIVVNTPCFVR